VITISLKLSVNKKIGAATFILALLFSAVGVLQSVSLAIANPGPYPDRPTPNTTPPILTVQSPYNTTYYENDVPLNLTVTIPYDWTQYESVRSISYQLDGQTFSLWDGWHRIINGILNVTDYSLPPTQQFSTALKGLARGQHVLRINVHAQSEYWPNPNFFFPSNYPLDTSQTILFTVDAGPFPSPSPSPSPNPSPELKPQFDFDIVYAYFQGLSNLVVFNITHVSDTLSNTIEVYRIEISSGATVIGGQALGLGTNYMSMDVIMGITISLPAKHSEVLGGPSPNKSTLRANQVTLDSSTGSGTVFITIQRLGWITVVGNSTERNLSSGEVIKHVQLEKFGNGFLYNTIVPEEQLSQIDPFKPPYPGLFVPSYSTSPSPSPLNSSSSPLPQEIEFQLEPFPTTLVIASVASMAVVSAGLLVYFKKRNHKG
jgi:hypothetical protein